MLFEKQVNEFVVDQTLLSGLILAVKQDCHIPYSTDIDDLHHAHDFHADSFAWLQNDSWCNEHVIEKNGLYYSLVSARVRAQWFHRLAQLDIAKAVKAVEKQRSVKIPL